MNLTKEIEKEYADTKNNPPAQLYKDMNSTTKRIMKTYAEWMRDVDNTPVKTRDCKVIYRILYSQLKKMKIDYSSQDITTVCFLLPYFERESVEQRENVEQRASKEKTNKDEKADREESMKTKKENKESPICIESSRGLFLSGLINYHHSNIKNMSNSESMQKSNQEKTSENNTEEKTYKIMTSHLEERVDLLGYRNNGATITIQGNAGNWLGCEMTQGEIIVVGSAADFVGEEMIGGILRIQDSYARISVDFLNGTIYCKGRKVDRETLGDIV